MNPFGRLRWFLGRLISPVRTIVPGSSTPSSAEVETDPVDETDDEE